MMMEVVHRGSEDCGAAGRCGTSTEEEQRSRANRGSHAGKGQTVAASTTR